MAYMAPLSGYVHVWELACDFEQKMINASDWSIS